MADFVKTFIKKVVSAQGTNAAQTVTSFNTALNAANVTAAALAVYPLGSSATGGTLPTVQGQNTISNDPIISYWDGTNYNFVSAVNYIIYV